LAELSSDDNRKSVTLPMRVWLENGKWMVENGEESGGQAGFCQEESRAGQRQDGFGKDLERAAIMKRAGGCFKNEITEIFSGWRTISDPAGTISAGSAAVLDLCLGSVLAGLAEPKTRGCGSGFRPLQDEIQQFEAKAG
jgi:hypothetical protein